MKKEQTDAIGWAFLEKFASKQSRRGLLPAGTDTPVELEISGKVKQTAWRQKIKGWLNVGHESKRLSSSAPDAKHLIAAIFEGIGKRARNQIVEELKLFADVHKRLPVVSDPAMIELAESVLQKFRNQTEKTIKGPVSVVKMETEA